MPQPDVIEFSIGGIDVPGLNLSNPRVICHTKDARLLCTVTGSSSPMAVFREITGAMDDKPQWTNNDMAITLQVPPGRKHVAVARQFLMELLEAVQQEVTPVLELVEEVEEVPVTVSHRDRGPRTVRRQSWSRNARTRR